MLRACPAWRCQAPERRQGGAPSSEGNAAAPRATGSLRARRQARIRGVTLA